MSTWTEKYKSNGVWAQLELLGPAIDQALQRDESSIEQRDTLERIRAALTFVGKRLGAADPSLASESGLNAIGECLRQATVHLQSFSSTGDNNQLLNGNAQLDTALVQSVSAVFVPGAVELEGLENTVSQYRLAMAQQLALYHKQVEDNSAALNAADARLKEVQAAITAEQQRVATAFNEWQGQFGAAQAAREQQGTSQTASFQEQFSNAQAARDTAHAEAQTKREERFNELHAQYSKSFAERAAELEKDHDATKAALDKSVTSLTDSYEARAAAILGSVEGKQAEVEKLVGVIGNLGVTSGHTKAANSALWSLRFWQAVAVAAMLFLVYVAYSRFLPAAEVHEAQAVAAGSSIRAGEAPARKGFDWSGFAIRVYVSLTVGVLAAYAGTQADKYYRIERKNRKMALELEAIGPFLAPLPEEDKQKFRLTIGDRSFGRDDDPVVEASPTTLLQLLNTKDGRELLAEVVKLAKSG
jgi:hypothetical protein